MFRCTKDIVVVVVVEVLYHKCAINDIVLHDEDIKYVYDTDPATLGLLHTAASNKLSIELEGDKSVMIKSLKDNKSS